ncbi:hypothetical protein V8F33_011721 [Rhypophila sp. PSN 637]
MTNTPESQSSASEITNNVVKPISVSAPAPFYFQLPSPQPTEQTSQHETSPTPLPTATLSANPNGPRRSTRVNTVATKSSHQQLGPEKPGPQKRLYVEINADGDAMNDGRGTRTAKRPRLSAVHSSTPAGPAHPLDKRRPERRTKSPGANQQELARPQSRRDSTPRGDNRRVHDHEQLQGPQARPAKPIDLETSREHLFQLTEMAWRWIPKDDAAFEALQERDYATAVPWIHTRLRSGNGHGTETARTSSPIHNDAA